MNVLLSEVFKGLSVEEDLQPTSMPGGRACLLLHSPAPWKFSRSVFAIKCWEKVSVGKPIPSRIYRRLLLLYHPEYIGVMIITSKCNH